MSHNTRPVVVGNRYRRLLVVQLLPNGKNPLARCLCDCGNEITTQRGGLKNGHAKSCGCLRRERFQTLVEHSKATAMPVEERRVRRNAGTLAWQRNNPDKYRAKMRAWYGKHRSRLAVKRAEVADRKAIYDREYRLLNASALREVSRLNAHLRRIRKATQVGVVSRDVLTRLRRLQRGKCAVCRRSLGTRAELDHVMPLALGGAHDDSNLQLTCHACNRSKGAKHPADFMRSRGFLL